LPQFAAAVAVEDEQADKWAEQGQCIEIGIGAPEDGGEGYQQAEEVDRDVYPDPMDAAVEHFVFGQGEYCAQARSAEKACLGDKLYGVSRQIRKHRQDRCQRYRETSCQCITSNHGHEPLEELPRILNKE